MRALALAAVVMACVVGQMGPADARPLLQNSQQTYAGACLEADDTAERLVAICEAALEDGGASAAQRLDMKLELANALYLIDAHDGAEAVLDEIFAQSPNNARALTISGWVDWDLDAYDAAIAHFEASVALGPTAENLAGLASAGRHSNQITKDRFVLLLDTALAMSPEYIWAQREKGWGLIDFGDLDGAEDSFRTALALNEDNAWSLYALGYVLNEMDRYDEALPYLNRAADTGRAPTGVYSQRALARFYEGQYKLSLKDADLVIENWPSRGVGYVRRARALDAMGQRELAISELRDRQAQGHDDFVAYWLADFLYDDGDLDAALAVLNQTFDIGAPDYYDHEFRAMLLMEMGRNEDAKAAVDAAIAVRENANFPFYYRALILVDEGEYDAADAAMLQAFDNGLPDHRLRIFLEALAKKGQFLRAIQWRVDFADRQKASGN